MGTPCWLLKDLLARCVCTVATVALQMQCVSVHLSTLHEIGSILRATSVCLKCNSRPSRLVNFDDMFSNHRGCLLCLCDLVAQNTSVLQALQQVPTSSVHSRLCQASSLDLHNSSNHAAFTRMLYGIKFAASCWQLVLAPMLKAATAVMQVQAQILPAPTLMYGNRPTDTTRRPGSWEPGKYSLPAKLPAYAIASFADRRGTEQALAVRQMTKQTACIQSEFHALHFCQTFVCLTK